MSEQPPGPRRHRTLASTAVPLALLGLAAVGTTADWKVSSAPGIAAAGLPGIRPAVDDWPTYGGDLAGSGREVTRAAVGATAAVELTEEWRVAADGPVTGEPVAEGDRVYFATWGDSVYCVDRITGALVWRTALDPPVPNEVYGPYPRIQNSPLLDGGRVYVAQSGGRVIALDAASGRVLWRSQPLYPPGTPDVLRSSLRAYRGVLYVGIGGLGDLPQEWGGVAALEERTGRILWVTRLKRYAGGGAAVFGTPALWPAAGLLFVTTGNPVISGPQHGAPYSDAIVALRLGDGHVVWARQTHPDDMLDLDFIAAPTLFRLPDGRVAVGAGEKDGVWYAFEARDGRPLWQRNLQTLATRTYLLATATVGDGLLYVGTEDTPVLGHSWPQNYGPPAGGRMVALDAATGRVVWSRALGAAVQVPPALVGEDLFVVDALGGLHVLDARTGRPLWQGELHGRLESASAGVAVAGDTLLVPLSDPPAVVGLRITWTSLLQTGG
jgi:polyvinyl alcohol dehydrogenase (cytochrome)